MCFGTWVANSVYTALELSSLSCYTRGRCLTFREQSVSLAFDMSSKKPAIAKIIVLL